MTERLLVIAGLIATVLVCTCWAGYLALGGATTPESIVLTGGVAVGAVAGIIQQRDQP